MKRLEMAKKFNTIGEYLAYKKSMEFKLGGWKECGVSMTSSKEAFNQIIAKYYKIIE